MAKEKRPRNTKAVEDFIVLVGSLLLENQKLD